MLIAHAICPPRIYLLFRRRAMRVPCHRRALSTTSTSLFIYAAMFIDICRCPRCASQRAGVITFTMPRVRACACARHDKRACRLMLCARDVTARCACVLFTAFIFRLSHVTSPRVYGRCHKSGAKAAPLRHMCACVVPQHEQRRRAAAHHSCSVACVRFRACRKRHARILFAATVQIRAAREANILRQQSEVRRVQACRRVSVCVRERGARHTRRVREVARHTRRNARCHAVRHARCRRTARAPRAASARTMF